MFSHQDFCISWESLYVFSGPEFTDGQGIRGFCQNGVPKLFYYDGNEANCKGYPVDISDNASWNNWICMDNHFLTCLNYICYGKEAVDPSVCSGRGSCTQNDICFCNEGYSGNNCELDASLFLSIATSIVLSSLESFFLILIVIIILIIVFFLFIRSKKQLKKFAEIEDIDIILSEQKLEKKRPIQKIKIDKSSFEIQRKDLELISILGQGGSETTVYLCKWNGVKCAYKSFKNSMNSLNEENSFVEFEKETKLFASIHHPSILRFYGACLNPPNIGILLEYCSFGDIPN